MADLIAYRQARETLVERVAEFPVKTRFGEFTGYAFVTPFDKVQHFAIVAGDIGDGRDIPARLHRADIMSDVFGGGASINTALESFTKQGRGVLVYLRDGAAGVPANAGRPGGRSRSRERAREELARYRRRRADPAQSRRVLDSPAHQDAAQICRPVGLRHRDHRHRRTGFE